MAIDVAACMAREWREDAVLHSVYSAHDNAHDFMPGGTGTRWGVARDGLGESWTVVYAASSAACGLQRVATREITVRADGLTTTGESCTPIRRDCPNGLPSRPPDSSLVVPAGWDALRQLTGFYPRKSYILAENLYDCTLVDGMPQSRQHLEVWAYWNPGTSTSEGKVEFDAKGKLLAVHGPCDYNDFECLSR